MALDLKLKVHTAEDCRNLVIEDITGDYSLSNLGGWGDLNVFPFKADVSVDVSVQAYIGDSENLVAYEGTFSLDVFEGFMSTSNINSHKDFKLSIPVETLTEELGIPTSGDFLVDTLYQVHVRAYALNDLSDMYGESVLTFKNTCLTSKLVGKALTSINLLDEDCDDSDLKKVLLAKSLLESLEN
tara:strand:- start:1368 stop:1922 length:555 start_codon:yes stop_codon:yes gene_type:complete